MFASLVDQHTLWVHCFDPQGAADGAISITRIACRWLIDTPKRAQMKRKYEPCTSPNTLPQRNPLLILLKELREVVMGNEDFKVSNPATHAAQVDISPAGPKRA